MTEMEVRANGAMTEVMVKLAYEFGLPVAIDVTKTGTGLNKVVLRTTEDEEYLEWFCNAAEEINARMNEMEEP